MVCLASTKFDGQRGSGRDFSPLGIGRDVKDWTNRGEKVQAQPHAK
jgi:hypothetical protein